MSAVSVASALPPPALSSWRSLARSLCGLRTFIFFYFLFPASFSYLFTPPSLMIGCCVRCGFSSLHAVSRIYHSSIYRLCVVSANLHLLEPAHTKTNWQYFCRRGKPSRSCQSCCSLSRARTRGIIKCCGSPKAHFGLSDENNLRQPACRGCRWWRLICGATPLAVHYAAHKSSWLRPIR